MICLLQRGKGGIHHCSRQVGCIISVMLGSMYILERVAFRNKRNLRRRHWRTVSGHKGCSADAIEDDCGEAFLCRCA